MTEPGEPTAWKKPTVSQQRKDAYLIAGGPDDPGPRGRFAWPGVAFAGPLATIWLLGGSLVLGAQREGYSPLRDPISLLGAQGAPNPAVWNLGGFGVAVVLLALYAIAVRAEFGAGLLFVLVVMQALAIAGVAAVPCDPGCPQTALSTG